MCINIYPTGYPTGVYYIKKKKKGKEKEKEITPVEITVITRGVSVWPLEGKNRCCSPRGRPFIQRGRDQRAAGNGSLRRLL